MPKYGTQSPPPALFPYYPSSQFLVFNAEAVVVNESSERVHLAQGTTAGQRGIRVELDFNADPGNFEFDIMESDADTLGAANYQQVPASGAITQANKTTGANGANTHAGTDLIPLAGQFCLLFVKTAPSNGSITVTARITRAA